MTANDAATIHEVILRPREPIIARDGRPFAATPGARAVSLPWPLPSTLAGALRTRIGTDLSFDWRNDGPDRARRIAVQGPLMLARWRQDDAWQVYLPQPRDALIVEDDRQPSMHALRPFVPDEGAGCDLPHASLRPLRVPEAGKALSGDAYWPISAYTRWLCEATPEPRLAPAQCLESPPRETRVHVAMNRDTRTGLAGALFSTVGLVFADQPLPAHPGKAGEQPLPRRGKAGEQPPRAMLCRARGGEAWTAAPSYLPLGGERRLVELHPVEGARSLWPACPPELRAALKGARRLRLVLATPAIFAGGWQPGWLDGLEGAPPQAPALRLRLVAAAVGRREPVSGWNLQHNKYGPKAARYMVPAGSVYFCDVVAGELDDEQIDRLWLASLSDGAQDRADGFGLAVVGVW